MTAIASQVRGFIFRSSEREAASEKKWRDRGDSRGEEKEAI
jgi:hypothetical protein